MKIARCILLLFIAVLFFGCSQNEDKEYKVLRYNQVNHITSLDPAFAKSQNNIWATHHIYDGLVRLDENLNIKPAIAKRWEVTDEGKTYTFYLKENVFFHKNECLTSDVERKVDAHDLVYSFNRLLDPTVNSPGSWLFSDKVIENGFIAVDNYTFQIKLNKPFIPLLGILTMQYCSVVPEKCVEFYGEDFAYNPVGTGPFAFKRWVINQALFLNRNDSYFDTISTNLDGIRTSFIPDKKIAFLELLNGKLDYVAGLESSFIQELLTPEGQLRADKKDKITFAKAPYLNTEYIGINYSNLPEASPLRIKEFRQALNLGIDRNLMLRTLRNGIGKPANAGIVPLGLPSHDPIKVKGYTYDPDSARTLINNLNLTAKPILELYTNKDYLDLTTFIAKQWEDLGVTVNLEVLESSILRNGMRNTELPMFRASWIADYPDAESFLCLFYSKYPAPPNYTRYSNEKYDRLYEESIQESDNELRNNLFHEMDNMLIEDAPVIFLFYDETAQFIANRASGINGNAINLLSIYDVNINN